MDAVSASTGRFKCLHASGHIQTEHLYDLIEMIDASIIMPVHTKYPAEFRKYFDNIMLIPDGETFEPV